MNIEWKTTLSLVSYEEAIALMEERIEHIYNNKSPELIWFLQHPHIYTAGSSANIADLVNPGAIPIYQTGRGGKYTYHGPGQRVIYLMLDLRKHGQDLHKYITNLENWIIASLADVGIVAKRKDGLIGVWVNCKAIDAKISAIGIRVRKWISYHGVAININPDLSYYNGIIACGIKEFGVTSLDKLGCNITIDQFDNILKSRFHDFF
jgi:lipoyl(octanoyl) transferase